MASQLTVSRDTRWGTQSDYTMEKGRCLCRGQKPSASSRLDLSAPRPPLDMSPGASRNHTVWVAFLMYDNDQYQQERSLRDYIIPMNWLTTVVTASPFIHCQLVLWDEQRKQYYTYSVDDRRPVHVYHEKAFRRGWRFVALSLTEREELLVHNFCVQQLGKPLNHAGQLAIFFMPQSGNGQSWFCSELVAAALAQAGLLDFASWSAADKPCKVAPHMLFDYLLNHCTACPVTLLPGNPVSLANLHKAAARAGKISQALTASGLPLSIASHATSATPSPPPPQSSAATQPPPTFNPANSLAVRLAALPARVPRRPSTLDCLIIRK
jgi:hypothetical protein